MPPINSYCEYNKLSEVKFCHLLRLLALKLNDSDATRSTDSSARMVNEMYLLLRCRLHQLCSVPVELGEALECDEIVSSGARQTELRRGQQSYRFRSVQTWGQV